MSEPEEIVIELKSNSELIPENFTGVAIWPDGEKIWFRNGESFPSRERWLEAMRYW